MWALAPLLAFLAWRLFGKERVETRKEGGNDGTLHDLPGKDSEFYLIEMELALQGYERRPGENLSLLLARLEKDFPGVVGVDMLRKIIKLHYQYRFDPAGLSKNNRNRLASLAKGWMESYGSDSVYGKEKDHEQNIGNNLRP